MRGLLGCAVLATVLGACVSLEAPRAGKAVQPQADRALVVGAIRMIDVQAPEFEYAPLHFDPWNEPFFGPGPRLTLELRQLQPPGGAVVYKSHPAPPIEEGGAFYWILPPGDYVLAGNPRLLGSSRFTAAETQALARFTVPLATATAYVGTLVLGIRYDLEDMVRGWKRNEAEYEIADWRVVEEREAALARLRARHPQSPEPVRVELMRTD